MDYSIEQLEKEVKRFRDNILISNELVDHLDDLIKQMKEQSNILDDIKIKLPQSVDKTVKDYTDSINSKNETLINNFEKNYKDIAGQLTTQVKKLENDLPQSINDTINDCTKRINSSNEALINKLENNYKDTTGQLTTKVNQLENDLSQSINKTINDCTDSIKSCNKILIDNFENNYKNIATPLLMKMEQLEKILTEAKLVVKDLENKNENFVEDLKKSNSSTADKLKDGLNQISDEQIKLKQEISDSFKNILESNKTYNNKFNIILGLLLVLIGLLVYIAFIKA